MAACSKCGQQTDTPLTLAGKKYCPNCYQAMTEQIRAQEQDYSQLCGYIKKIFGLSDVPAEWKIMIDKYAKEGKQYSGMMYTLYYCYEIEGMNPTTDYGLYVIKYKYDEARQYYMKQQATIERNMQKSINTDITHVTIKNPVNEMRKPKFKMEDL